MDESREAARIRRRTVLFGWSAVTFGLLVFAYAVTLCVVMYVNYKHGLAL